MTVVGVASAAGIVLGIDMQDDPADFPPIGTVGLGIEHAHVGDRVLLVVDGEQWAIRR
jgi:hypothetical protein